MIPVDAAKVEHREIVLGVQDAGGSLVRLLAARNVPNTFLGNGDLEPAQGIRLVSCCLLQKDRQRFFEPLEKVKCSAQAIPIAVRLQ